MKRSKWDIIAFLCLPACAFLIVFNFINLIFGVITLPYGR